MTGSTRYHVPVLADAVVEMLCTGRSGVVVDGTLGGGGHFDRLAAALDAQSTLVGIDRDADAVAFNRGRSHPSQARIIIEQSRFSEVAAVLNGYEITHADGILLDLGVSSFQIDTDRRGFSYMRECELDMRMNGGDALTAAQLIAQSGEDELATILGEYGEVRNPFRMARAIKHYPGSIETSTDLRDCLNREYGSELRYAVLAKVFQALRIAVNDELGELSRMLDASKSLLNKGGRIAVITYHSLEDRMVKEFFKNSEPHCICQKGALMCTCGTPGTLKRITRKPVAADTAETKDNPRARSARLRVAEKISEVTE